MLLSFNDDWSSILEDHEHKLNVIVCLQTTKNNMQAIVIC